MSNALSIAAIAGVAIAVWVLYLYKKKKLKEDYTILWLLVAIIIVLLSTWTDLLLAVNWFVGAEKVSDVVLAAFIAFLIIISIYFSVRLSHLAEQNKKLAQEIAISRALKENPDFSEDFKKKTIEG
jgi:hypothetical protein